MNAYRRKLQQKPETTSKRWETTAGSALEDVARQLKGNYDRAGKAEDLRNRKLANTQTSISFGNAKINYISDAKDNQTKARGVIDPVERAQQLQRIKDMKKGLTTTSFKLGDEKPEYESILHSSIKNADSYIETGKVNMNVELKEAIKRSSLHFGNEPVVYQSVAHDGMTYRGNENDFSALKSEVKEMTATLRRHNFTFGDEKVSYQSDYQSGYGSLPIESYRANLDKKSGMKAVIEDSRSCHFSLGNDKVDYMSNTHRAQNNIGTHSANDVAKNLEHAKEMKAALQRTSINIGDDKDYY